MADPVTILSNLCLHTGTPRSWLQNLLNLQSWVTGMWDLSSSLCSQVKCETAKCIIYCWYVFNWKRLDWQSGWFVSVIHDYYEYWKKSIMTSCVNCSSCLSFVQIFRLVRSRHCFTTCKEETYNNNW